MATNEKDLGGNRGPINETQQSRGTHYTLSPGTQQMTTLILGLCATMTRMVANEVKAQDKEQKQQQQTPVPEDNGKIYYTANEISELISVPSALIQQWGREGLLRRHQVGKKYQRYVLAEVLEDLEQLKGRLEDLERRKRSEAKKKARGK